MQRFAYVTMLFGTRDRVPHIECLAHRLRLLNSTYDLHVLTDQSSAFDDSRVHVITSAAIVRPHVSIVRGRTLLLNSEVHHTLNKVLLWNLTRFRRIVYMDPDIYLQKLPDVLNATTIGNKSIAAVHGCGGYFNSGFMVIRPDAFTFTRLVSSLRNIYPTACDRSPNRDQSYLNGIFKDDWMRLDPSWNTGTHYAPNKKYEHLLRSGVNIHFVAERKPRHICNSSEW